MSVMRYLFVAVALIACGDNGSAISFEERDAAETRARCERLARCGEFQTVDACVAFFRPRLDVSLAAAVARGIVTFNPFSEEACLDDLAAASCDRTAKNARVPTTHCQGALRGTLAIGASCAFDGECMTGRCDAPACPVLQCCTGMCQPAREKVGGMCSVDADCVEDSYCSDAKTCVALEAAGGPCRKDSQCGYGLACVGATSFDPGTCRELPALGERCPYDRCADINARCDSSGTCVKVGLPGDACTTDAECSEFALCDPAQNKCVDVPTLGMPCDSRCGGEAFCSNGTCMAPLGNGDACGADGECASQICAEGPIFDACAPAAACL